MTSIHVPEELKLYFYVSVGMILVGVLAFIVSLFFADTPLLSAGIIAIACGFLNVAIIGFGFMQLTKKKDDFAITMFVRILYLLAIGLSTYMIIFSGFYVRSPINYIALYITIGIAIPVVITSLIIADIFLARRRKEEKESIS
ncbi:MAG: hypothetical protein HGN29_11255 [Asgard group archaeon]|nr:hypothetical protein [Asgard group archaeon]